MSAPPTERGFWREVYAELMEQRGVDLVLRLSALLAMFYAVRPLAARVVVGLLLGATLFSPRLRYLRGWWLTIAAMALSTAAIHWYREDNHKWLWSYWLLACGIAVGYEDDGERERVLALNGRLLLGLCMGYATAWKLLGGQYLDGTFFIYELHFDARFARLATMLGQSTEAIAANVRSFDGIGETLAPVAVGHTRAMLLFALAAGWWTIVIEGIWTWAFLVPWPRALHERRDAVLLLFVGTTYFLAPVHGFGSLLVVMGLAQCPPEKRWSRAGYLVALVVLHVAYPWAMTLADSDPLSFAKLTLGG